MQQNIWRLIITGVHELFVPWDSNVGASIPDKTYNHAYIRSYILEGKLFPHNYVNNNLEGRLSRSFTFQVNRLGS